jgi:hypothetical protein
MVEGIPAFFAAGKYGPGLIVRSGAYATRVGPAQSPNVLDVEKRRRMDFLILILVIGIVHCANLAVGVP